MLSRSFIDTFKVLERCPPIPIPTPIHDTLKDALSTLLTLLGCEARDEVGEGRLHHRFLQFVRVRNLLIFSTKVVVALDLVSIRTIFHERVNRLADADPEKG